MDDLSEDEICEGLVEIDMTRRHPFIDWQPMATAPLDGTPVLCFVPDDAWDQPIRVLRYNRVVGWEMPGISGLNPTRWTPIPSHLLEFKGD